MSASVIIGIVIVVVVVVVLAAIAARGLTQRHELRERYGDEYQRVVTEKGGRSAAEAELKRREREHEKLELNELSPEVRDRYRASWTTVQSQFVDDPKAAVHTADELITELVTERGYPVAGYDDRLAQLSVEHASVLNLYRSAHDISLANDADAAATEDLRQALVSYRELIADLLGDASLAGGVTTSAVAASSTDTTSTDTTSTDTTAAPIAADDTATGMPVVASPPAAENPAPVTPPELRTDANELPDDPDADGDPKPVPTLAAPARDEV
jgi:hypothetical protein